MGNLRKNKQAGFTLIELLMVVLIIGILAGVGLPMYLGYTRDARMSEGKALIGSLWTALRGCAQTNVGTACTALAQFGRIGVGTTGITTDGQWDMTEGQTVTLSSTTNQYTLDAALGVDGIATKVTEGIQVRFAYSAAANPPGSFTCSPNGGTSFTPC